MRKRIPEQTKTEILIACRRKCCLCWSWKDDWSPKEGNFAHIDRDPSNASKENLVFLCFDHHNQNDSKPSQGAQIRPAEVKDARDRLAEHLTGRPLPSVTINLRVDKDFATFTDADQERTLNLIRPYIRPGSEIRVKLRGPGSVVLTLHLEAEDALELMKAFDGGCLRSADVLEAWVSELSEVFDYLVYLNPRPQGAGGLSAELRTLKSLCWEKSSHVRWRIAVPGRVAEALCGRVLLLIVDCTTDLETLKKASREIRTASQCPVLLLVETSSAGRAIPVPLVDGTVAQLRRGDLSDKEAVSRVLKELGVVFPTREFQLNYNEHDVAMAEIVQLVSTERLQLVIQKFFPYDTGAGVSPVAGGWSGARLCRLFVGGSEYFLKFFDRSEKYRKEVEKHAQACQWLRQAGAAVNLRYVPELARDVSSQMEAFPQAERPDPADPDQKFVLPVCYESASPPGEQRETLKALYRTKDDKFVEPAFGHLLDVLDAGQPDPPMLVDDVPWAFKPGGNQLCLDRIKGRILEALDDLELYGDSLCAGDPEGWQKRRDKLKLLALGDVPGWLAVKGAKVSCGLTHGDPNPRNCLVLTADAKNLRLIDCGDFEPRWRLVSDLAQIEREIKLVLMGTENQALPFHDLNTARFHEWCEAERAAIERGMEYQPKFAPVPGGEGYRTAARAYHLIGMVRQRAKKHCGKADDKTGVHYFAALLFWTLDALRYKEIRRTKKLLALYSASEILRKFGRAE
jgi:hypothetical protein